MNKKGIVYSCPVEVFGVRYNSIKEAYRELNFPCCYETLIDKVKNVEDKSKGKVLEEMLCNADIERNLRNPIILGIRFKSLNEACREFGIDVNKAQMRRKRGWNAVDSILGKVKLGRRVLSKKEVSVVVKKKLEEGWGYDEALQFFDGDTQCDLNEESDKLVKNFFDLCEDDVDPMEAFCMVFEN